jgi:hypothetical protein
LAMARRLRGGVVEGLSRGQTKALPQGKRQRRRQAGHRGHRGEFVGDLPACRWGLVVPRQEAAWARTPGL